MSWFAYYFSKLVQQRIALALITALLYFVPPFALSLAALGLTSTGAAWSLFTSGILMAALGTVLLLAVWRQREAYLLQRLQHGSQADSQEDDSDAVHEPVRSEHQDKILHFQQDLEASQREQARYVRELETKNQAIGNLSQELELYRGTLDTEREKYQRESHHLLEQIQQHKILQEEYHQQIAEQKQELVAKEQAIIAFENKIRDLTFELRDQKYELQMLLKVSDFEQPAPLYPENEELPPAVRPALAAEVDDEVWLKTSGEALLLLKRCLETARKIAAPSYYTSSHAPFGQAAPTSHPLDVRRLYDSLCCEKGVAIVLYSPREEKVVCATPQIETLSSWSPEAWVSDCLPLLGLSASEWRSTLHRLTIHGEVLIQLALPTRQASVQRCQGYFGTINGGLFRNYVIGVLFPVQP